MSRRGDGEPVNELEDDPVFLFEMDLQLRQAWVGIWVLAGIGAVFWIAGSVAKSPLYAFGLVSAGFVAWANTKLRDVVTENQQMKWILVAVLGLVVEFGSLILVIRHHH